MSFDTSPTPVARPSLKSFSFDEFCALAQREPRGWFWRDVLPASGTVLLAGAPFSGKSTLIAMLAAAATSKKKKIAGRRVRHRHMLVAYLEHQTSDFVSKLRSAAAGIGIEKPHLTLVRDLDVDDDAQVDQLHRLAKRHDARVIVIDSFRRSTRLDENRAQDVSYYGKVLAKLTAAGRRLVIVIHHNGKSGEIRGSTDFSAMVDSTVRLSRHGDVVTLHAQHHGAAPMTLRFRLTQSRDRLTAKTLETEPAQADERDDVRDFVVQAIRDQPGCSVRQLREAVRVKHSCRASHQAIQDCLNTLIADKVIENKGRGGGRKRHRYYLVNKRS